ncbi:glutathione S-transferase T2-like [Lactuca sativa]|uniref:glutathione S-transferase T2-like n=1 Tax=Lactuca sativa TaxID=4236 RepID=UPI000CD887AC|nr:glutathione S-transferase T2-like [Lactuca sativa]
MLLEKPWLQISEDNTTGSQQRDKEFWRRISAYYEKSNTSNVARTEANLKMHWHCMNPFVVAFNQIYIVLKIQHLSGWSEDDLKSATFEHYHARYGADFRHEHIWHIVKNEQKWKGSSTASGASMSSSNTKSFINLDNDEVTTRPIGWNAAKKSNKRESYQFHFFIW